MRGLSAGLAFALVALLAFVLRESSADAWRREAEATPQWLVDDPDAAYHLRRVAVALEGGEVPLHDNYLSYPEGSAVPWPALFDQGLALGARVLLGEGARDEASQESLLVHAPPLLGALTALAVCWLVLVSTRGASGPRLVAAALGGALYAACPIAIWYGGVTRVDHHVATALLLALQLGCAMRCLSAESAADAVLWALATGAAIAGSLLIWLGSAVMLTALWVVLLLRALARDPERAKAGARAGAFCFATAALLLQLPASASPWNELTPGSLLELTEGVPRALLAGALPFALCLAPPLASRAPAVRAVVALLGAALAALVLPGFLDGVRGGLAWASRHNLFMDVVQESRPLFGREGELEWSHALNRLGHTALLLPLALVALLPSCRQYGRLLLWLCAALALVLTLQQERFGNSLAVPMAAAIALALHPLLVRRPRLGAVAAALVLALAVPATASVLRVPEAEREAVRAWRAELVDGLRWLRVNSDEPSPWYEPAERPRYGVLAHWGFGHLIEYHARRPSIATNFGSFVGEDGFRDAAQAMLETDPMDFREACVRLGVRYVVVTPRHAGDLKSLARIAGREGGGWFRGSQPRAMRTALYRLALPPQGAPDDHYPGFERVYQSAQRESTHGGRAQRGELAGPVISIYRLRAGEGEAALRPR